MNFNRITNQAGAVVGTNGDLVLVICIADFGAYLMVLSEDLDIKIVPTVRFAPVIMSRPVNTFDWMYRHMSELGKRELIGRQLEIREILAGTQRRKK